MGKQRKTSSIVWKINAYMQRGRLGGMLFRDVFLLAAGFLGWCAAMESRYGALQADRVRLWQYEESIGWWERLTSCSYSFMQEGQESINAVVDVGTYFRYALPVLAAVFGLQILGWTLDWMKNNRRLRNYMRPIDEAAMAAERISALGIDERRIQNLEEAIDQINFSEAAVNIGDKDLMGLENAINNLLKRLQASYREQTRFVDDASHELRTPIAVIQGYASMLERWGMNDRNTLEESVHAIREEADHI